MLIPFLQIFGLGTNRNDMSLNSVTNYLLKTLNFIGLPLTIGSVLFCYFILTVLIKYINYRQNLLNTTLQNQFTSSLRCDLFKSIIFAEWNFIAQLKSSNIAHVITSDIPRVSTGTFFFMKALIGITVAFFYILWALMISAKLTFFALLVFCATFYLLKSHLPESFQKGATARNALSGIYSILLDHINGLKIAKSYCLEKEEYQNFVKLNEEISATSLSSSMLNSRTNMIFTITTSFFLCVYLYLAMNVFQIGAERVLLLILIFSRLAPCFLELLTSSQHILGMFPSFLAMKSLQHDSDRHRELSNHTQDTNSNKMSLSESIKLENINFSYGNESEFELNGITLEIPAGKITALIGHSGSGKSTIADLISGMLKPDSGAIKVDDTVISKENLYKWKRAIGYMPQEIFLFHDTIRNNLIKGNPDVKDEEIFEALRLSSAYDLVMSMNKGLDTVVKDRGLRLSGGERQRISLSRTILRKPSLLILDEATSALDVGNEKKILEAIKQLRGKYTLLIISHKPSILNFADKVINLKNGKILNVIDNSLD